MRQAQVGVAYRTRQFLVHSDERPMPAALSLFTWPTAP